MAIDPATDSAERLHLADRLALRPKEAAEALGVSKTVCDLLIRALIS